MRYIFISDVHGQFEKMIDALNGVDFNKERDTLISLGDLFDRGPQSLEVLEYVMSCPNRILIWGNHDLRLRELMLGRSYNSCDYSNGVLETMKSFCGNLSFYSLGAAISVFKTNENLQDVYKLLWQYFDECHFAVEFSKYIGTHAWIPVSTDDEGVYDKWGRIMRESSYFYTPYWRDADFEWWFDTTWGNTQVMFRQKVFAPGRVLIIGHWHAWRLRKFAEDGYVAYEPDEEINFSSFFYKDKLIAIDGCSNLPKGIVNALVLETDETPILIDAH